MLLDHYPISSLSKLLPCFRKVVSGFRDNGDYWLKLNFYQGGLRAPRIFDASDKQKVKTELTDFLRVLGEPQYTGQIEFYMKHGKFTNYFNVYPGAGSNDKQQKEGIRYVVSSSGSTQYLLDDLGKIPPTI